MNETPVNPNQNDLDVTVAFQIAFGVLLSLGGLLPFFGLLAAHEFSMFQLILPWGFCSQSVVFALSAATDIRGFFQ